MLALLVLYTIDVKKTLAIVLAVSIAALLFAGCGSKAKSDTSTKESWLFSLQSAGTTSFDQSSSVLSMPVGNLVGFTDRPNRDTRDLTPTIFAALWTNSSKDSFSADPPNASLTYWDSDGTDAVAHTVIVEITGNVSSTGNVLSMTLQILSPSGVVIPAKMYRASLFVDNSGYVQPEYWFTRACQSAVAALDDYLFAGNKAGTPEYTELLSAYNQACYSTSQLKELQQ